jgi:hypothetical protein
MEPSFFVYNFSRLLMCYPAKTANRYLPSENGAYVASFLRFSAKTAKRWLL